MNNIRFFSNKFLLFFYVIFMFSCEDTSTIDMELNYKQELVCTGFIGNGMEPTVYLQLTHHPMTGNVDTRIEATVNLIQHEETIEMLSEISDNFFKGSQSGLIGHSYSLHVETIMYGTIHSDEIIIPSLVPIDSYTATTTPQGKKIINVFFNDPAGVNYYAIKVLYYSEDGTNLDEYDNNILSSRIFDDALATNGIIEYEVPLHNYSFEWDELHQVKIVLYHYDTNTWNYYQTLRESEGSLDDIWTEPTMVYSNMHNGIGVFGGFSSDTLVVSVDK